jgi:hypothetical protein
MRSRSFDSPSRRPRPRPDAAQPLPASRPVRPNRHRSPRPAYLPPPAGSLGRVSARSGSRPPAPRSPRPGGTSRVRTGACRGPSRSSRPGSGTPGAGGVPAGPQLVVRLATSLRPQAQKATPPVRDHTRPSAFEGRTFPRWPPRPGGGRRVDPRAGDGHRHPIFARAGHAPARAGAVLAVSLLAVPHHPILGP